MSHAELERYTPLPWMKVLGSRGNRTMTESSLILVVVGRTEHQRLRPKALGNAESRKRNHFVIPTSTTKEIMLQAY